jgi:hypothetical protein
VRFAELIGAKQRQKLAQRQPFLELKAIPCHAETLCLCAIEMAVL